MEVFKKVLSILFRIFLIIVLLVLIIGVSCNLILNMQRNSGEERPSIFGLAPISIADNKLSPDLNDGDFIIISNTGNYEIGDIITIEKGGEFITQRIIGVDYFNGRNDVKQYKLANHTSVIPSMIYGEMVLRFEGFAPIVDFFQTIPGVSILIGVAVLIIFMPSIVNSFRKKDRESKIQK